MAARRDRLDAAIAAMAARRASSTPVVHRLGCLRGISTLTGFALATEIGDWHRFTGESIGAFVGLVPSEYSSGGSRAQGPITKTGNSTCADCWSRRPGTTAPVTSPAAELRRRWDLAPATARARGDAGNRRLHQRWVRFLDRRKRPTVATVAIARELAGWCWSLAIMD